MLLHFWRFCKKHKAYHSKNNEIDASSIIHPSLHPFIIPSIHPSSLSLLWLNLQVQAYLWVLYFQPLWSLYFETRNLRTHVRKIFIVFKIWWFMYAFLSGNTTPINVYGEIHITNTLGDGRIISEMIKPFLLKNYSGITSS